MVRPVVNRLPSAQVVADEVAKDLFEHVRRLLSNQAVVHIALTGGTVGIASLAACRNYDFENLDLNRLHIWWGDERFVSVDSLDRNAVQARNSWLKHIALPAANIHEFPASEDMVLEQAAFIFNEYFENAAVTFDVMLMGMGPDGHVASIFPGKKAGDSTASVEAEPDSPKPPPQRLTFTYKVINSAKQIWFTVAGADKAEAVASVFEDDACELPAAQISGKEKTVWYIDQTAASGIFSC